VSCFETCVRPTPHQAHCAACHVTFGGIVGFDRHRRDGRCLQPIDLGMADNGRGVWRVPMNEDMRSAFRRKREAAETVSGVVRVGVGASDGS
jgi:hypothetical protein